MNILGVIAIIISGIALYVSWQAWHKSRAVYDIEKYKFPKRVGNSKTNEDKRKEAALKGRLKTGKWQISYIYERSDDELMIIITKLKK